MVSTDTRCGKTAFVIALTAVAVGAGVIAGWILDVEFLKRIAPGFVAMNPSSAVAFVFAGASLALLLLAPAGKDENSRALILTARLFAFVVAFVGLARLVAIIYGWDLGADQWIFAAKLQGELRFPNRIAPNAALNFLLLGGALILANTKSRPIRIYVEFSVVVAGLGSLLAILGYAYNVPSFYRLSDFTPMALHTAIIFLALSGALLLSYSDSGIMAVLAGKSAGGTVARRLLPAVIVIPAVCGWLELKGELAGIYDSEFGNAIYAVANIVAFTFLICWCVQELYRTDTGRHKAVEALRESEERFAGAFEHAPIGVALVSPHGRWIKVNRFSCDLVGYSKAELLARTFQDITLPADRAASEENVRRLIARETGAFQMEKHYVNSSGHVVTALTNVSLVHDGNGQPHYLIAHIQDITERKQAQEALQQQKTELRVLFDLMPALVWFKDTHNRILRVNQRVAELAGTSIEDLEGKTCEEIYPREAVKLYADDLEVIRTGAPKLGIIETIRGAGGKKLLLQKDKVPYFDKDGRVIGIVVMAQDITERTHAEKALQDSEEKFRQVVNNISAVFWITSPDLKVIRYVSPGYRRIWGRLEEDLYANPHQWVEAILPEERERVFSLFDTLTGNNPEVSVEYRIVRPDGEIRWVHDRGFQVRNTEDQVVSLTGIVTDITERKRIEESLQRSQTLARMAGRLSRMGAWSVELPALKVVFSDEVCAIHEVPTGFSPRVEDALNFYAPEYREIIARAFAACVRDGTPFDLELQLVTAKNRRVWVRSIGEAERDAANVICRVQGAFQDITERKGLEAQLVQSQKLETVGKLAGGVAHEFNSILTAIIGQGELLLGDLPAGSPLVKNATEISKAAMRAATLTRQLLAYGRKQVLKPEILDLNPVLVGMNDTLRHLMGRSTDVRLVPATDLKMVKADVGQIEQVIMNLAMNAADAMPEGGKLTIETANVTLGQEYVSRYPELRAGEYVMLAITDTGAGMSEQAKSHVFEPFFTTKDVGEGAGLGLSTCYGIIKQSGGHVSVYSELGHGTTFKIYLPQFDQHARSPLPRLTASGLPRGTESILLVEDDPAMGEMAAALLRRLGYTVLVAANGIEALGLMQERDAGPFDLLFTDVVMPQMNGKELSEQVQALYPDTRILFTSAYTANAIVHQGVLNPGVALLQKPFTPGALAQKVRAVLDPPLVSTPARAAFHG